MPRARRSFGWLVLAQAAHSTEEYAGRLWESFPPARFLSGLVSNDLQSGFLLINISIVAFGVWCYAIPVSRNWAAARALMTGWAMVELVNGVGHPLWSIGQGRYTPGAGTAPLLLVLSVVLLWLLRQERRRTTHGQR